MAEVKIANDSVSQTLWRVLASKVFKRGLKKAYLLNKS